MSAFILVSLFHSIHILLSESGRPPPPSRAPEPHALPSRRVWAAGVPRPPRAARRGGGGVAAAQRPSGKRVPPAAHGCPPHRDARPLRPPTVLPTLVCVSVRFPRVLVPRLPIGPLPHPPSPSGRKRTRGSRRSPPTGASPTPTTCSRRSRSRPPPNDPTVRSGPNNGTAVLPIPQVWPGNERPRMFSPMG